MLWSRTLGTTYGSMAGPSGVDEKEWWANKIEQHKRLLQYGEFIEHQEAKGKMLEPGCSSIECNDDGDDDDMEYDTWQSHNSDESDNKGSGDLAEDQLAVCAL